MSPGFGPRPGTRADLGRQRRRAFNRVTTSGPNRPWKHRSAPARLGGAHSLESSIGPSKIKSSRFGPACRNPDQMPNPWPSALRPRRALGQSRPDNVHVVQPFLGLRVDPHERAIQRQRPDRSVEELREGLLIHEVARPVVGRGAGNAAVDHTASVALPAPSRW